MAAIPDRSVLADRGSRHRSLPLPALELPEIKGNAQAACDDL